MLFWCVSNWINDFSSQGHFNKKAYYHLALSVGVSVAFYQPFLCLTSLAITSEDGGGGLKGLSSPPQRFYKGGSAPAEILLDLIAVSILANPATLDVANKGNIQ